MMKKSSRGTFDKTWEKIAFVLVLAGAAYERRQTIGLELFVAFVVLAGIVVFLDKLFDRGRQIGSMRR